VSALKLSNKLVEEMGDLHWNLRQLRARIDMGEPALAPVARELSQELDRQAEQGRLLVAELEEREGVERAPVREVAPCCGGRGPRARRDGFRWDSAPLDSACPDCGARHAIVGGPSDVLAAFDATRPAEIDPDYRRAV
jgi:hypothetical protein